MVSRRMRGNASRCLVFRQAKDCIRRPAHLEGAWWLQVLALEEQPGAGLPIKILACQDLGVTNMRRNPLVRGDHIGPGRNGHVGGIVHLGLLQATDLRVVRAVAR